MAVFSRIGNLFRRTRLDREIHAELQAHIEMRIEENVAAGLSREAARRDALLRFGNPSSTRERVAAADATLGLDGFTRDILFALRQLRRSPGFALTAVLTLALGIGANVAVFGMLNAIILRPLNVPGADRLFEIEGRQQGDLNQSYPDYIDLRARNTAFEDMATFRIGEVGLSTGGVAQRCWMYEVSGNYFDMLGVQPAMGRMIHQSDERGPNSAPYIVLSDIFWRAHFNADPRVVGMVVELDKHPFTIVGVAPRTFNGTELVFWPDFWMPIVNEEQVEGWNLLNKRTSHGIFVLGLTRPGVTVAQAMDNLKSVTNSMARDYPTEDDGTGARMIKPGLMGDVLSGPSRAFLAGLMALALLVLLAASANLAGIFVARAADRSRELAIRISIGSTRWRILRQVLAEAVVVAAAGGVVGTFFAVGLLGALTRWRPIAVLPIHVTTVPDFRVYAIAILLILAGGILPGLLPARQIWRTDAMQAMKSNSTSPVLRRLTLRDVLLCVQIALCAVLVTASLVSLRGMERSLHAPLGFQQQGALLAKTDLHMAGYSDDAALPVQRRILDEASRIPGVTAVGTIDIAPLSGSSNTNSVYREGTTDMRSSNSVLGAQQYRISPGFLQAAGTRLLSGRDISWADGPKTTKVALVNETFARRMFGNQPAVGRHFVLGDKSLNEVVGVVEDGKYESLTEDPTAGMFLPLAQNTDAEMTLIVRTQGPLAQVAGPLSRIVTGIDSSIPVAIRTWPEDLALVLFPARAATVALGVMGLLAAMLATTGIFGTAAYAVSKRLRELGIRVALGAKGTQVMRAALGRPFLLLITGSAAGVLLGALASRLLAALVYQATSRDPLVLAGSVLTMLLVGLIATWIPARRALSVNPAQLLRDE